MSRAPPGKDVDDKVVVEGDLLQEDLSTWMGPTCPICLNKLNSEKMSEPLEQIGHFS